ncbi:MAG: nucleotidyl transferase AbiEii/AbiGii toxin family protein [Prevotellaceae bacterium]|jgi:predicted nucleotidyltransferase component of viral defense system|nr:nucleotidyl transferase AbiEii/AbiGii toxin family protein [Prevotellaceae bacterium]
MIDNNKHRYFLVQILKDIYSDRELANLLGFKGGTALMFFYDLPRFSVDLDFNLLDAEQQKKVYDKIKKIMLKYGTMHDEAQKFYGSVLVLNYSFGQSKLKVEVSNRDYGDLYESKNFMGVEVKTMKISNMFSHKLCALLDRKTVAARDIFDCWFFMSKQTPVIPSIIESRMNRSYTDYVQNCIEMLETLPQKNFLDGLGDLLEQDMKTFVRNKLRSELLTLLRFYKEFPITN